MLEASGKKQSVFDARPTAAVGGRMSPSLMDGPGVTSADDLVNLRLDHAETLEDGLMWLRYGVGTKNA